MSNQTSMSLRTFCVITLVALASLALSAADGRDCGCVGTPKHPQGHNSLFGPASEAPIVRSLWSDLVSHRDLLAGSA